MPLETGSALTPFAHFYTLHSAAPPYHGQLPLVDNGGSWSLVQQRLHRVLHIAEVLQCHVCVFAAEPHLLQPQQRLRLLCGRLLLIRHHGMLYFGYLR